MDTSLYFMHHQLTTFPPTETIKPRVFPLTPTSSTFQDLSVPLLCTDKVNRFFFHSVLSIIINFQVYCQVGSKHQKTNECDCNCYYHYHDSVSTHHCKCK